MRLRTNEYCPIHQSRSCCGREQVQPAPKLVRMAYSESEARYSRRKRKNGETIIDHPNGMVFTTRKLICIDPPSLVSYPRYTTLLEKAGKSSSVAEKCRNELIGKLEKVLDR
jgi:hypothetical protein